jgi:molybdopterin adenylyltransferase
MLEHSPMNRIGLLHLTAPSDPPGLEQPLWHLLRTELGRHLRVAWEPVPVALPPSEQATLEQQLIQLADEQQCSIVFTTGGIGPLVTDVAPEATRAVCHKQLPGFGELIRRTLLSPIDPSALLLRPVAGIRFQTVLVNLPASVEQLTQCLPGLFPAIPNAYFLASGRSLTKP